MMSVVVQTAPTTSCTRCSPHNAPPLSPAFVAPLSAPKSRIIDNIQVRLPAKYAESGSPDHDFYPQLCFPSAVRLWTTVIEGQKTWVQPNAIRIKGEGVTADKARKLLHPLGLHVTVGVKEGYRAQFDANDGEVLEFASSLEATQALEYAEWLRKSRQTSWLFAREEVHPTDEHKIRDVLMVRKEGLCSPVAPDRQGNGLPSLASSVWPGSTAGDCSAVVPVFRLRIPSADPDLAFTSASILLASVATITDTLSPRSIGLGRGLLPPGIGTPTGLDGLPFLQPAPKQTLHLPGPPLTIEMLKPHQWRFDPHYSRKKGCPPASRTLRDILGLQDAAVYKPGQKRLDVRLPSFPSKQVASPIVTAPPSALSGQHAHIKHYATAQAGMPPGLAATHRLVTQSTTSHPLSQPLGIPSSSSWQDILPSFVSGQGGQVTHGEAAKEGPGAQAKQGVTAKVSMAVQSMWQYRVQP